MVVIQRGQRVFLVARSRTHAPAPNALAEVVKQIRSRIKRGKVAREPVHGFGLLEAALSSCMLRNLLRLHRSLTGRRDGLSRMRQKVKSDVGPVSLLRNIAALQSRALQPCKVSAFRVNSQRNIEAMLLKVMRVCLNELPLSPACPPTPGVNGQLLFLFPAQAAWHVSEYILFSMRHDL